MEEARQYSAVTTADQIAFANVIATFLTPLAVVGVGFWLDRRVRHFERIIEDRRQLTGTRFELYKEIGFQLNDIFSYFNYVGSWQAFTPSEIVDRKRQLDRHVYTYKPLFSRAFFKHYMAFMQEAFSTHNGWGEDAKLRSRSTHRIEDGDAYLMAAFTQEDNIAAIRRTYAELIQCLAENLGVSAGSEN